MTKRNDKTLGAPYPDPFSEVDVVRKMTLLTAFVSACLFYIFWNALQTWVMIQHTHLNDFGKFYHSAVSFMNGQSMYQKNISTLTTFSPLFTQHLWDLTPPHFHILILPLTFLSPLHALLIWGLVSFFTLMIGLKMIGRELHLELSPWESRLIFLSFLAFSGTGATFVTGQLSFLLFLPITMSWIFARQGKWQRSSLWLGALASIKPFLCIFIPYFLMKRQFSCVGTFILTFITCFVLGIGLFGIETHISWIQQIQSINWTWAAMNSSLYGALSRTFLENPYFAIMWHDELLAKMGWIALSIVVAILTLFIVSHDSSKESIDRAFALLLLSAVLISPLGWIYYLLLAIGPLTPLIYQWYRQGKNHKTLRRGNLTILRNIALFLAIPGLLIPIQLTLAFQPNPIATITIGSAYCLSTLALWLSLVLDWRNSNARTSFRETIEHGVHRNTSLEP